MTEKNINHDDNTLNMIPKWLNEEFFLKVIKHFENTKNINLKNLKLNLATGKGDHYASILFRAELEYEDDKNELKKKSMIIKAMVEEEGEKKDLFKDSKIFETEIEIYSKVIPKFESILKEVGDETKFAPRCLYYALQPQKVIIFEDLTTRGYIGINDRSTNFEETKAIYTKIAKWHALSYKINLEEPEFLKFFVHDIISSMKVKDNPAFNDGILNFIDLLNSQPDLIDYIPYFKTQIGKISEYWEKAILEYLENRQTTGLYVLNHGDFHHRNVMFKFQKQNDIDHIEDILLIDFQMSYIGSIANDIINSIFLMMDGEQRLKNIDQLLYIYFETFKQTLKKIGFNGKIPKICDFYKEKMRSKGFELYGLTSFLPMMMAIDKGTYNIDELMTNATLRKNIYKDPEYIEQVRQLLRKYLYSGCLED